MKNFFKESLVFSDLEFFDILNIYIAWKFKPLKIMTRYESCVGAAMILTLKRPPSDQEIAYLIRQLLLMPILGEFYKFGDYFHQLANLPVIDAALVFFVCRSGVKYELSEKIAPDRSYEWCRNFSTGY